ncbi:MAG: hypothetical protein M1823_002981 [Watsoniomyces obsoletus]|nr:MAG: hypothetical protein M1823_002981 [Watsoniomyces obsoletus]
MSPQPGKLAPRLIEDLLQSPTCRHKLMLKPDQSALPVIDSRPDTATYYKIASYCMECRSHVTVEVDYRISQPEDPCPARDRPLHHLQLDQTFSTWPTAEQEDQQQYVCPAPACGIVVRTTVRPPRLSSQYLSLLIDPAQIESRVSVELNREPERLKGLAVPEPIVVLKTLRTYLADALKGGKRRFASSNKIFLTTLGPASNELLQYLGFQFEDDATDEFWALPSITRETEHPQLRDAISLLVDDVDHELQTLINGRPWAEKAKAKLNVAFRPNPALKDFERALGSLDYHRASSKRLTSIDLTTPDSTAYSGLGALSDFSDKLIIFAYERQTACDPDSAPHYLSCLKEIAQDRQSEELTTQVALLESTGQISQLDIDAAYQYLQIDPSQDDASVIGAFQARISDAPIQEAEARQHLQVVGTARRSESIKAAATNKITTYQEALAWLGADENTSDEFIITLLTMKSSEPNFWEDPLGAEVLRLIAEARQTSSALLEWMASNQLGGGREMNEDQAYARLGVEDRSLDDDTVVALYEIRVGELPSEAEQLRKALTVIGEARKSHRIAAHLHDPQGMQVDLSRWPVGLENIGNTCYLNSLLQFYFTLKPLRELILDFHRVEMTVTPESLTNKRVGGRMVSAREIDRAKSFVLELQKLFRSLITAPTASIAPERELARLTLIKSSAEEEIRRRSTASVQGRPDLGTLNGVPVQGPTQPLPWIMDVDEEGGAQAQDQELGQGQGLDKIPSLNSSEATLVEKPANEDGIDAEMSGVENSGHPAAEQLQQTKYVLVDNNDSRQQNGAPTVDGEVTTESEANNTEIHSIQTYGPLQQDDAVMTDDVTRPAIVNASPPVRPPPVPPRPERKQSLARPMDELELGAQQDVTEVIGNVLFQLECAMRAVEIDGNGEQLDEIKQLFYGKARTYIEATNGLRAKEEYFSDIKVNVASGPSDIYTALDGAFDVQEVSLSEGTFPQYTAIAQLPPILQIQIQRAQFDAETKRTFKSEAFLQLQERIFLDRYMDDAGNDPNGVLLQKRRQVWEWKEELEELEGRKRWLMSTDVDMTVPDTLRATIEFLKRYQVICEQDPTMEVDPELPDIFPIMEEAAVDFEAEMKEIDEEIAKLQYQIEHQFDGLRTQAYRLAAVFIHRGTATFGHYWIYIRDFLTNIWRKYNDGYVTQVPDPGQEIFSDPHSSQGQQGQGQSQGPVATPYYVVYVREDVQNDVIDPVRRDPVHQESGSADTAPVGSGGGNGNWLGAGGRPFSSGSGPWWGRNPNVTNGEQNHHQAQEQEEMQEIRMHNETINHDREWGGSDAGTIEMVIERDDMDVDMDMDMEKNEKNENEKEKEEQRKMETEKENESEEEW